MPVTLKCRAVPRLVLEADTASDLMTSNPISLRRDASIRDAVALLSKRAFTAAPVIDEGGRPIGVVSITDILVHDSAYVRYLNGDIRALDEMGHELVDATTVEEIMTPGIVTVPFDVSAFEVVKTMLSHNVHRLFVSDEDGTLMGVISMGDVVRHLTI
jgi:CBS domain-containing protein